MVFVCLWSELDKWVSRLYQVEQAAELQDSESCRARVLGKKGAPAYIPQLTCIETLWKQTCGQEQDKSFVICQGNI
jgi:hypothetical protein